MLCISSWLYLAPPAVIGIFYNSRAVPVNQLDDIPLTVAQVVIVRPVEVHSLDLTSGVVGEAQGVCASLHADQYRTVVVMALRCKIKLFFFRRFIFSLRRQAAKAKLTDTDRSLPQLSGGGRPGPGPGNRGRSRRRRLRCRGHGRRRGWRRRPGCP